MDQAVTGEHQYEIPDPGQYPCRTVTPDEHYTDRLFRFRITLLPGCVPLGRVGHDRPAQFRAIRYFRAYSIASPSWDDELDLLDQGLPDGPLTEHLQKIESATPS